MGGVRDGKMGRGRDEWMGRGSNWLRRRQRREYKYIPVLYKERVLTKAL